MVWNTSDMSASHLSHTTAMFVFYCYQIGPTYMFGLKMELMACAGLVGGTTEQSCILPGLIWYYQWYEILLKLSSSHLSRATAIFVVDCCQFGPIWMFGLKMEIMGCAGWEVMVTVRNYFISLILSYKDRKNRYFVYCTTNQSGTGYKLHFQPKNPARSKLAVINNKNGCGTD